VLRDAFSTVLAPPPLRLGVVGANSFTSFSRKRAKKIRTPSSATHKTPKGPQHTNLDRRPVLSSSPQTALPPQPQYTQTDRSLHIQTHSGSDAVIDLTEPPACATLTPRNTLDVLEVSPHCRGPRVIQCMTTPSGHRTGLSRFQ